MKKRMRLLSVLLCVAMVAGLSACGSKKEDKGEAKNDGKIKLTFSTSVYVEEPHQKAIDALLEAYNKKNPDVEIEILGAGYDGYWDNITTEILANNESDMIQVYPENISTYHAIREDGTFIDLSDYMSDELKGKLVGQDMCDVNGETLAISSYAWGTTGIFYRKSMLEDAGVDPESIKTQEDFREACAKFTKDGKYAMGVVSGTHAFTVSEWSRLIARPVSGGLYFPNGESEPYTADNVNVNAPENVWAAQWWQDFILKDKAAKLVTMISKNCEHPDEAYAFLEWMTTDEAQALIADCGMIPSNTDYSTSDEYIKNHELEYAIVGFMQNNYAELIADPNIAQLGEISQVMLDAAQKMFSEQAADVQTEMDNAQKQIEEVMSRQE